LHHQTIKQLKKMENVAISIKALQVIANVKKATEKSITGVSFVSIRNYENKQGEVSNNLINVGASYAKAKQKDIEFLENLVIADHSFKSPADLIEEARIELIKAFLSPNEALSKGQTDAYTQIVSGVKIHNETGAIYVYGYRENKTILKAGEYKEVKSKPLTIAKNELRKLLRTGKFTQYAIETGNEIRCNGETLEL
jgi:hypothetical protein